MQTPPEQLKNAKSTEGLVLGSVEIRGGKDALARTRWILLVSSIGGSGRNYSLTVHRDGPEVFFATKLPAGKYRFYKMYQDGFSIFFACTNVQFDVVPGTTKYLGKLAIDFPDEYLRMTTVIKFNIENTRENALPNFSAITGLAAGEIATDLMRSKYSETYLWIDSKPVNDTNVSTIAHLTNINITSNISECMAH